MLRSFLKIILESLSELGLRKKKYIYIYTERERESEYKEQLKKKALFIYSVLLLTKEIGAKLRAAVSKFMCKYLTIS
jgi:hypothetical protein